MASAVASGTVCSGGASSHVAKATQAAMWGGTKLPAKAHPHLSPKWMNHLESGFSAPVESRQIAAALVDILTTAS